MARSESPASHDPFRAERAREAGAEKREQTKGPSLEAIKSNPQQSEHFSQVLTEAATALGDPSIAELGQRFAMNKPQQGDYEKLESYRLQYAGRLEAVKGVVDALSPAEFNQIVSASPELLAIANAKGDWNVTRGFFAAEMANIAFSDRARFESIAQRLKDFKDHQEDESYQQQVAETRAVCSRYNVAPARLAEITRGIDDSDPNAETLRREAVRNELRKQITSVGRIFDTLSGGRWTKDRVAQLETKSDVIIHESDRIREFQQEIGNTLAMTVDESPAMFEAFVNVGTPEAREQAQETYISAKEAGSMIKVLSSEDAFKAAWADAKAADPAITRDAFTQKYINSTLEKGGKRKGLFAALVKTVTKAFVDAVAL